jgi:uncharacterized membrane protein YgcG
MEPQVPPPAPEQSSPRWLETSGGLALVALGLGVLFYFGGTLPVPGSSQTAQMVQDQPDQPPHSFLDTMSPEAKGGKVGGDADRGITSIDADGFLNSITEPDEVEPQNIPPLEMLGRLSSIATGSPDTYISISVGASRVPVSCGPNYWVPSNLRAASFDFGAMVYQWRAHLIALDLNGDNPGLTPSGVGDQYYVWDANTYVGNLAIWPGYNHQWRYYECAAPAGRSDATYNTYVNGYYCYSGAVASYGSIYCTAPPNAPTELTGSCDSNGKVTVSWKADVLATKYDLRINNTANGFECATQSGSVDSLGDVCTGPTQTSNSYSFAGKPGAEYSWWVYGWNSLGYGPYAMGSTFSCPVAPTTSASNPGGTGTGTGGGNSGSGTSGGSTGGTSSGGGAACTQDAKICPDGSSVGRVAPSCEFAACPSTSVPSSPSGCTPAKIESTLRKGMSGSEVKLLQSKLALDKSIYPEANVSGFFGDATFRAVQRFQGKNSLEKTGSVGPQTRSKFNALYCGK